jgi:hypothetical protein
VQAGPGALVVEGAAGIGKTVLRRALVEQAVERGYTVLSCQAERAEAGLILVGLADLLAGVYDAVLATLPEPQRELWRWPYCAGRPVVVWSSRAPWRPVCARFWRGWPAGDR